MEFISFAIPFAALVFLTVIVGGLMNYYMDQRGLAFNPYLTYLLLPAIVGALYFVGGFSMWTVKGIVLALILLRASVQDLSERKADEFLWVMLLILALVNYKEVGVTSMLFGALGVFLPQFIVVMFFKTKGQGGADFKFSTAAALCLGFYGGVIGYMIGLVFAIVFQTIYNKVKKQPNKEAFPLLRIACERASELKTCFLDEGHKGRFYEGVSYMRKKDPKFIAQLYLLSASELLWIRAKQVMCSPGFIDYSCLDLKLTEPNAYLYFCTAMDIQYGGSHIDLYDLTLDEIVDFDAFRVICNSVAICLYGMDAVKVAEKRKRYKKKKKAKVVNDERN